MTLNKKPSLNPSPESPGRKGLKRCLIFNYWERVYTYKSSGKGVETVFDFQLLGTTLRSKMDTCSMLAKIRILINVIDERVIDHKS